MVHENVLKFKNTSTSVRKCKLMNPNTLKWISIFGNWSLAMFKNFKTRFEGPNLSKLFFLIHWKVLEE
jgi:hypothetical protein